MYEYLYYLDYNKKKKKNDILKSILIGFIVGVVAQFVIDIIINIINKKRYEEIVRVASSWQVYFTAIIAGGINGALVVILPKKLFPIAAILVITTVYNVILSFSSYDEFISNIKNGNQFITGIIRDIFIVLLILGIINQILPNRNNKKSDDIESLLGVTIVSSVVLNVSFYLSQTGLNLLLGINKDLASGIAF